MIMNEEQEEILIKAIRGILRIEREKQAKIEQKPQNPQNPPEILTIDDVAIFLKVSKPHAYELAKHKDFPAFRIGRTIRVEKNQFFEWLKQRNEGKR